MSLDIIPKLPFPNVPNLPGVPLLARAALSVIIDVTTVINIARVFAVQAPVDVLFHATKAKPVWGVFNTAGARVINADNVMAFDYRAEWALANFPVQQGAFASYNKVTKPFDTSVVLTKGGSEADRTTFLNQCETVAGSLDLFNILTPEKQYIGVNGARMEMSRKEVKGAFFVVVELFFQRIEEVDAQYSTTGTQGTSTANASTPTAVPPVNNGNVQAMPPTPQVATTVVSKLTTGQ
jgi:hypothetical protein